MKRERQSLPSETVPVTHHLLLRRELGVLLPEAVAEVGRSGSLRKRVCHIALRVAGLVVLLPNLVPGQAICLVNEFPSEVSRVI